jgi:hypothetical protein
MRDEHGFEQKIQVGLIAPMTESVIGEPMTNPAGDWSERRLYREEAARLTMEKRLVQYRPEPGQQMAEHKKALSDVRCLIRQHGKEGAWLWDPYLTATDVLNTLFYCPFPNSDLRALTAAYDPPADQQAPRQPASCAAHLQAFLSPRLARTGAPPPSMTFAEKQRAIFDGTNSNWLALRFEYRIKSGSAGWAFHDRFLIFPMAGRGALAWSLGTSINSLGKQHHILQQVDDGQLILEAFRDLWDELGRPEHLVWKTP